MIDDELKALLREHPSADAPRFATGFAERVMKRVGERESLDLALVRQARRVLPALAAASLMLAAWNYVSLRDRAPSTLGAVLGVASTSGTASAALSTNGLVNVEAFE